MSLSSASKIFLFILYIWKQMPLNMGTLLKGVLILKCLINHFPLVFLNLGFYHYTRHILIKKLFFIMTNCWNFCFLLLCLTHTSKNMIALLHKINILYTKNLVSKLSIVFLFCLTILSIPIFVLLFSLKLPSLLYLLA